MVTNAVMTVLGQEPSWANAKRLMADPNFKDKLRYVNPEIIPIKVIRDLGGYMKHPDFTPEKMSNISVAAGVMCLWVRAITTYAQILHDIQRTVDGKVSSTKVVTYSTTRA